ncbi:MAG: DUF192 domain-containing protein [Candidatus Scalinduaceae bacterium]
MIRNNKQLLRSSHLQFLFPLVLISALCSCTKQTQSSNYRLYEITINRKPLQVEVAATYEERKSGLMYREKLNKDSGMLFIYPREKYLAFWMKNTKIPLTIAFINDNGLITQIESMTPYSLTNHTSKERVRYALEMEDKWFMKNGITVGSKVDFSSEINKINVSE